MSFVRTLQTCMILAVVPSAAAQTQVSPAAVLGGAGLDVAVGDGEINGVAFEIGVVRASRGDAAGLASDIATRLAGRATVTENASPQGKILIVWNLQSSACPTCAPVSPGTVDVLFDTAVAITVFELPGGGALAIATPAGAQLRAASGPAAYRGALSHATLGSCRFDHRTIYRFDGSTVANHGGISRESPRELATRIRNGLLGSGYIALGTAGVVDGSSIGSGTPSGTFFKGATAVHYRITPTSGGSRVEINESTASMR